MRAVDGFNDSILRNTSVSHIGGITKEDNNKEE